MSTPQSFESINSGLDLFTVPPLQTSVERGLWVEHHPLASITPTGPIEFIVKGAGEDYIDLTNTFIHVRAKITKEDGSDLVNADDDLVAPVNLFLQALFSEVDISLNGVLVSTSTNTYPYRAYLETILSYGEDAKKSQLANELYYKKGSSEFTFSLTNKNAGLGKRRERSRKSKIMDMVGRIHGDIFTQEKFILNGVDIRLRFVRSKNTFALLAVPPPGDDKVTHQYRIKINHMSLFVRKAKLNPAIAIAHGKALQNATAKYPIKRVVTKVFSAPQGNMNVVQENLFLNQRPNRLVIGLVSSKAFNGDFSLSPFEFRHFDVNSLALFLDGQQIPAKPFTPDFTNKSYARSYMSLFTGTGTAWKDQGNMISYDDYPAGFAIWVIDLTPSLLDADVTELTRPGNLRLELGFGKPLPEPVHIVVLGELDGMIEVDRSRQVLTDYTA